MIQLELPLTTPDYSVINDKNKTTLVALLRKLADKLDM